MDSGTGAALVSYNSWLYLSERYFFELRVTSIQIFFFVFVFVYNAVTAQ
jgi:hypothetical protein